jgi:hypothetical protein
MKAVLASRVLPPRADPKPLIVLLCYLMFVSKMLTWAPGFELPRATLYTWARGLIIPYLSSRLYAAQLQSNERMQSRFCLLIYIIKKTLMSTDAAALQVKVSSKKAVPLMSSPQQRCQMEGLGLGSLLGLHCWGIGCHNRHSPGSHQGRSIDRADLPLTNQSWCRRQSAVWTQDLL